MATDPATAALRRGQRVMAQWYDTGKSSPGKIVELAYRLDDGSRVFSVEIDGTEYVFNERHLRPVVRLPADIRRELRALDAITKRLHDVGPAGRKWLRDVLTADLQGTR